MSIGQINLRNLLQLLGADHRQRRQLLLKDIAKDRRKEETGASSRGGDFYGPFWADAKNHAAGLSDIVDQTRFRIDQNYRRDRLYKILRDSFLEMLRDKMRWTNEKFTFSPKNIHGKLLLDDINLTVKVENAADVHVYDGSRRIMYPYFSEEPAIELEISRIGFWILAKCLPEIDPRDFRLIDLHRRAYIRFGDVGFRGDEENQLRVRYTDLIAEWNALKARPR
jgi:hypothetical protein